MEIRDLDYLSLTNEVAVNGIEGGYSLALSRFSANAFGSSSLVTTSVDNRAITMPKFKFASSSVRVISAASGWGSSAVAFASSYSEVGN
jgi:hypothetical protein